MSRDCSTPPLTATFPFLSTLRHSPPARSMTAIARLFRDRLAQNAIQRLGVRRRPDFAFVDLRPMGETHFQHFVPEGSQLFIVQIEE